MRNDGLTRLTDDLLKRIASNTLSDNSWPEAYGLSGEGSVDAYLKELSLDLQELPNILLESDFDSSSSGLASYVRFFFFRADDPRAVRRFAHPKDWVYRAHRAPASISLAVSCVAPAATFGDTFMLFGGPGIAGELAVWGVEWEDVIAGVKKSLKSRDILLYGPQELSRSLPFNLPDTHAVLESHNRVEVRPRVFDLLFWDID